ncbi:ABC transporter permease [Allonocardiopsis opalescens]|uniref:NitT/TauT family transport system permease protein n=1 Tax=Allonocardiopsis opalescens TaxID=1144618 RepID=A0A2T0Q063_9ACTN|nr:ABC transporter permease [Allonocardiopsis opalescens]PRX97189.1 NitT/TauT family transport system permease protein [Allonocardiopsis opalescens]
MNRRLVRGACGVAGFLVLAEVASRTGLVDPDHIPPVSTVLLRAVQLAADVEFLGHVGTTLTAWALGLAVAIAVAVPLGLLIGSLPWVDKATQPLVEFLRPIPSVALIPLAIMLLPDTLQMKTSVIVYASMWPILINTVYALRDVDPVAKETLRSFGFNPFAVLWRVSLPSAAPFIATGVRVAAATALVLTVSAEIIAGRGGGIGFYTMLVRSGGINTDLLLGAIVWAGVIGILINFLLVRMERRVFRWHSARAEVGA